MMAIFGNLGDIPLPDLLPMLGRRTGVLELWNLEAGKNVSLWLETGQLKGVWLTGKSLEANQARNLIIELLNAKHGSFEFMLGQPKMVCQHPLNWSVERLLAVNFPTGENPAQTQLPDPHTKFQAIALEVWLDEPLFGFWQKARPLLARGASSAEIAQQLGLPTEQVQQYLHRLRLAGRVSPVKAFQIEPSSRERQSLISRLLAALSLFRRRS
jgi:hypothetical protein